jgi:hypothetical protein
VAEGAAQGTPTGIWRGIMPPNVRLIVFEKARSKSIRPVRKPLIITLRQSRFGARRLAVLAAKWYSVSLYAKPRKNNNHDQTEVQIVVTR